MKFRKSFEAVKIFNLLTVNLLHLKKVFYRKLNKYGLSKNFISRKELPNMRFYPDCGPLKLPCAHGVAHFSNLPASIGPAFTKNNFVQNTILFNNKFNFLLKLSPQAISDAAVGNWVRLDSFGCIVAAGLTFSELLNLFFSFASWWKPFLHLDPCQRRRLKKWKGGFVIGPFSCSSLIFFSLRYCLF